MKTLKQTVKIHMIIIAMNLEKYCVTNAVLLHIDSQMDNKSWDLQLPSLAATCSPAWIKTSNQSNNKGYIYM